MKKRLLAWLLAIVLVVGTLPSVALATDTNTDGTTSSSVTLNTNGTVIISETTYTLCLGQGTLKSDGSLGYWLDPVDRGFIPGDTDPVNEFKYYLFLRGSDNSEATQATYEQFWAVCQMTDVSVSVNGQSDSTGVTLGEIGTASDGYHKYIPVSVTGERGGEISVAIKHTGGTTHTLTKDFQYAQATELPLNTDSNSYSISIENAVKGQSYFYYINLGEEQTVTVSGTLANDPVGRLGLAQTAEGDGESMLWWRFNSEGTASTASQTITTDKLLLRVVNNDGGTISGTVTVTAVQSGGSTQPDDSDNQPIPNNYVIYKDNYVIGFALEPAADVTIINETGDLIFGQGTKENTSNNTYRFAAPVKIAAATRRMDTGGTTIYDVDSVVTNSLTINKLWLEVSSGDDKTFSWSDGSLITSLTSASNPTILYVKEGHACTATVYAEVSGSIAGNTFTETICSPVSLVITDFENSVRPANDTVEQLNAFLQELSERIGTDGQRGHLHRIYLADTTYTGTIIIPSVLKEPTACIHLYGAAGSGQKTVINGSINLNGAQVERIKNVHFIADETENDAEKETKALYGSGVRDIQYCSFYGYDIALDSSNGLLNSHENVFVNNDIAASVDLSAAPVDPLVLSADWNGNTFVNNTIAVQVISLNSLITPYYFRVYNSNFISTNAQYDFDVQCAGNFYMYNNFFGKLSKNQNISELLQALTAEGATDAVSSNSAKISCEHSKTKVTVNTRAKSLVLGTWQMTAAAMTDTATNAALMTTADSTYENILIIDPTLETRIINNEADTLEADASTFSNAETNGETIQMDVVERVNNEEVLIGTWTFD